MILFSYILTKVRQGEMSYPAIQENRSELPFAMSRGSKPWCLHEHQVSSYEYR